MMGSGDRFNTDKRKIGKAHYHEEYSPWAVKREYRAHAAKVRNRTTSIPKGIVTTLECVEQQVRRATG